jgi:hypothetical protein
MRSVNDRREAADTPVWSANDQFRVCDDARDSGRAAVATIERAARQAGVAASGAVGISDEDHGAVAAGQCRANTTDPHETENYPGQNAGYVNAGGRRLRGTVPKNFTGARRPFVIRRCVSTAT